LLSPVPSLRDRERERERERESENENKNDIVVTRVYAYYD